MTNLPVPAASLIIAVVVQLSCQLFKFVVYSIRDREVAPRYFVTAGGMPSAHSAFAAALAAAVAFRSGIDSDVFAVAFVFGAIVAYDAYRLRGHVQMHAVRINELERALERTAGDVRGVEAVQRAESGSDSVAEGERRGEPAGTQTSGFTPVPEMVGHTPAEIIVGILYGAGGALLVSVLLL